MSIKWTSGLDEKSKKALEAETRSSALVFSRLLDIINKDIYVSVKEMRKPEVCADHSKLVRELGRQQYAESLIELINQITGKNND